MELGMKCGGRGGGDFDLKTSPLPTPLLADINMATANH